MKDNVWTSFEVGVLTVSEVPPQGPEAGRGGRRTGCAPAGAITSSTRPTSSSAPTGAVFFDPHANVGIGPSLGPMRMLHRGVPLGDVLRPRALMGNEERITAETALRLGLVTRWSVPRASCVGPAPGGIALCRSRRRNPKDEIQGTIRSHLGVAQLNGSTADSERAVLHADRQLPAGAPGAEQRRRSTGRDLGANSRLGAGEGSRGGRGRKVCDRSARHGRRSWRQLWTTKKSTTGVTDGVATVILNRPSHLNAFTTAAWSTKFCPPSMLRTQTTT